MQQGTIESFSILLYFIVLEICIKIIAKINPKKAKRNAGLYMIGMTYCELQDFRG